MTRKLKHSILVSALLALASGTALAESECELTTVPIVPDGNVASEDELIAAQKAYKAYEVTTEEYRSCLMAEKTAIEAAGGDPEEMAAKLAANLAADNVAVDQLVGLAEEFNQAVRAFKAR